MCNQWLLKSKSLQLPINIHGIASVITESAEEDFLLITARSLWICLLCSVQELLQGLQKAKKACINLLTFTRPPATHLGLIFLLSTC